MYTLFLFFYNLHALSSDWSLKDTITDLLRMKTNDELLKLRDSAYLFIDAINDELVKDGR